MVSNGDTAEDRGESIRIAAVQFPFIPIVIHDSENNWLSEPDGKINYWLNGKEIAEDFPVLSSVFLPQFSKEMTEHIRTFLSEDYQDWLYITIKDILYSLVKVHDVDIILFPEYSLPLEINSDLKSLIMSYSDGRCIVGGVGSICKNSSERKNRFFICNNNDIVYGEKVQPNNMEIDAGIKEGEGPLIHEIQLRRISQETIFTSVLMCSDSIEKAKDGSRVQDQLIKELNEKELDRNKINLSLIPALSTKTTDMENIGKICAPRFHEIVVLANCSFFGESCIWYPPTPGAKSISTNKVDRGDSACLIADIPLKFLGAPTSTTVGKPTSPQATPKYEIHKIVFRDE